MYTQVERERDRETERDKDRDRQIDRQTDRNKEKHSEKKLRRRCVWERAREHIMTNNTGYCLYTMHQILINQFKYRVWI